jgi:hypothetical protein
MTGQMMTGQISTLSCGPRWSNAVRDDFQVLIALRLSRLPVERPSVVDYSKHLEQSGSMRVLATTTRVVTLRERV